MTNLEIFDSLKKGDKLNITFGDAINKSNQKKLIVSSKNTVGKGKSWESDKVTFTNLENPTGVKFFAYKRKNGNVSFAIGDMAISNVKIELENKMAEGGGVGSFKVGDKYYFKTNDNRYIYGQINNIIKYSGDIEFKKDINSDDTVYPNTFLIYKDKIKNLFKEIPKVNPHEYEYLISKYLGKITGEEPQSINGIAKTIKTKEKNGSGLMVFSAIQKNGIVNFNENAILTIKGKSFDKDGIELTFTNISKQNNPINSQSEYVNFVYSFSFKIKYSNLYADGGGVGSSFEYTIGGL